MIRKLIVAINQRSETLQSLLNLGGPIDQRPPADRFRNPNILLSRIFELTATDVVVII